MILEREGKEERERKRQRERQTETQRNIDVREKQQSIAFGICPKWGLNP